MSDNLFQERLRELEASVEEGKKHSVPDTEREKDLAAAAHPKDKITHKDVLVKRGVLKAEGVEIDEQDLLALRGVHSANPQSVPNYLRSTEKGKKAYAKKNLPDLKKALKNASGKHHSPSLPEEVELEEKTLTPAELKKREEVAKAMERDKPGMDKSKKMAIATAVAKRVAESMQIDELSKKTLGSYVKAAAKDAEQAGRDQEYHGHENDYARGEKRQKGIAKAVDRMTKEDVEQVSELSKTTLAAYYAKSISDRHSKDLARDSAKRKGDEKEVDALGRKVTNRSSGLEKAKAKFFKEDTDPTN